MSRGSLTPKRGARFRLIVQAEAEHPDPVLALRAILKALVRRHGFRCVSIGPEPRPRHGVCKRGQTPESAASTNAVKRKRIPSTNGANGD